ncbi:MAG TPA: hypothetical protein VNR18_00090 [Hyphomicrobiales bacterium]|nr:hypothetical protein [Hyphomicrobiales bacterium]
MKSRVSPFAAKPTTAACRHVLQTLLLGGAALLLPITALAEGSPRRFDCAIIQSCDADGNCQSSDESITLHLEPQQIDADGSGTYVIRYGGKEADMRALSEAGPFYWALPSERNTLLVSGDTQILWHRVKLGAVPGTSIDFMHCSFRQ